MNLAACGSLTVQPENRVWFRAIQPQHWPSALATGHSRRIPSRYSPATSSKPGFPILYLSEDHQVALFEVGALLGSPLPGGLYVPNPWQAWIILNVQVTLQAVADLTNVSEQNKLQTTAQELTGDWRGYYLRHPQVSVSRPTGLAPTQSLGREIHRLKRFEGFRAVSARVPTHLNLVVFPNRLRRGSTIIFTNPKTKKTFSIKGRL
jgi:RES domain-containing protein